LAGAGRVGSWRQDDHRPAGGHGPSALPDFIYPLDYGYLEGTTAADGGGIDVWVGSLPERRLAAVVCCVDRIKRDTELKLLFGCTPEEMALILAVHNSGSQSALLVRRGADE
jgi:inorganic pyrophosphatase